MTMRSRSGRRLRWCAIGVCLGGLVLTQCVGEPPRFDTEEEGGRGQGGSNETPASHSAGAGRGAGTTEMGSEAGGDGVGAGGAPSGSGGQLSHAGGTPSDGGDRGDRGDGGTSAGLSGAAGQAGEPLQRCDPTGPFTFVENVSELNDEYAADSARLSADQLKVYFSYVREDTGEPFEVHFAERMLATEPFSRPSKMPLIPSASGPTVSANGTLMVYVVDEGNEGPNLYVARPPFNEETSERLEVVRSKDWEYVPYLSYDERELYFVRRPSDGELNSTDSELWIAPRSGDTFGAPVAIDELNRASVADRSPVLSADGLRLYFASNRPTGSGPDDIYMATRPRVGGRFDQPVPVSELNTSSRERPNWISPDDCTLYFASDRLGTNGGTDVWRAERERRF